MESTNEKSIGFGRLILLAISVIIVFLIGLFIARPHYGTQIYKNVCKFPVISSTTATSTTAATSTTTATSTTAATSTTPVPSSSNVSQMNANTTTSEIKSFLNISLTYKTDKVTAHHYEILYEKYLRKYVGSNLHLLEIELGCGMPYGPGASAHVWRTYLGPLANIYFLEFNRLCGEAWHKSVGHKLNITMFYGSQDDVAVLNNIKSTQGQFDVIVDDGGHTMNQQITSFINLLPKVKSGGMYVIEDLLTSYMAEYGGGYLRRTTTVELIKKLVDNIQTISP